MPLGMANNDTALRHHLFEILQAQDSSQIPVNIPDDDIDGIMQPPEGISDHRHGQAIA